MLTYHSRVEPEKCEKTCIHWMTDNAVHSTGHQVTFLSPAKPTEVATQTAWISINLSLHKYIAVLIYIPCN